MDEYSLLVRDLHITWFKRGFIDPWGTEGPTTWGRVTKKHKIVMVSLVMIYCCIVYDSRINDSLLLHKCCLIYPVP